MAPTCDLERLKFLTDHEEAAIAFLNLEAESRDSTGPMHAYLKAHPQSGAST
jgi:hypothetical protein